MTVYDDIIGHDRVIDLLLTEADRPSQAYLFVGPQGVGKGTIARRFAGTLICETDRCRDRVLRERHPDVVVVTPEGRTMMGVEQARSTIAQSNLTPVESDRKVFILDEASSMSEAAANAMLKTLEEPSGSTIFILVADAEDDLPPTIASRCRTVRFGRVGDPEIAAALEAQGIDHDHAAETARIAGGRPGLALAFATQPEAAEFRTAWLSVPGRVSQQPGVGFMLAEEMLAASKPLLAAVESAHEAAIAVAEADGAEVSRAVRDRHERAVHRAGQALTISGLEMLASWYTDAASAQFGGPVRNPDVPAADLVRVVPAAAVRHAERILETVLALQQNQRPQLVLASLFNALGADT